MNLYINESKGSSIYRLPAGELPLASLSLKHGGVARFNVAITAEEGLNPVTSLRFGIRRAEGTDRKPVLIAEATNKDENSYELDIHLNSSDLDADFAEALSKGKTSIKYEAEFEWMRADADGSPCRTSSTIIPLLLTHAIIQTGDTSTPELSHYPAPADVATKQYVQDNSSPKDLEKITFKFKDADGHERTTYLYQANNGELCYWTRESGGDITAAGGGILLSTLYNNEINIPSNGIADIWGRSTLKAVNGSLIYTHKKVTNGVDTTTSTTLATTYNLEKSIKNHNDTISSHPYITNRLQPNGGLAGQVLVKTSSADGDSKWIDPPSGGAGIKIKEIGWAGYMSYDPATGTVRVYDLPGGYDPSVDLYILHIKDENLGYQYPPENLLNLDLTYLYECKQANPSLPTRPFKICVVLSGGMLTYNDIRLKSRYVISDPIWYDLTWTQATNNDFYFEAEIVKIGGENILIGAKNDASESSTPVAVIAIDRATSESSPILIGQVDTLILNVTTWRQGDKDPQIYLALTNGHLPKIIYTNIYAPGYSIDQITLLVWAIQQSPIAYLSLSGEKSATQCPPVSFVYRGNLENSSSTNYYTPFLGVR